MGQVICIQCFDQNDSISENVNNLLQNGSFENGCGFGGVFCPLSTTYSCDITGWTCTGGGVSTYANIFSSSQTAVPDGAKAVYMGSWFPTACSPVSNDTSCLVDSGCVTIGIPPGYPITPAAYGGSLGLSLQQTVTGLVPGKTYILEFWAGGENYTAPGLGAVDVGFGYNYFRYKHTPAGGTGTVFLVMFIANSTSHTIKFTNWGHICSNCTEFILDNARLYTSAELSPSITPCTPPVTKTCFGDTASFNLSGTANLYGAQWNFGDPISGVNNFSSFFNPQHYYSSPGTYTVEVIRYYALFTDTFLYVVTITTPPVINLGADTSFCSGTLFTLDAGSHHSYLWQNGSTNSTFTATAAGTYFVTVEDTGCYATDSIVLALVPCNVPVVNMYSSDSVFCGNKCIDFYDSSTNNPTSWQWFFAGAIPSSSTVQNPSNVCYSSYGSFDVTLIACNSGGCDTLMMPGFINSVAPPTVTITKTNDTLYATPAFSYQWYNVATGIIAGSTGSYFIPVILGNYYVVITNSLGCTAVSNIISITAFTPAANLMCSDSSFCGNKCIGFYDLSTNNPTSWQWVFSGGVPASSTMQNPSSVCYNSSGSYDVTLIACNGNGCDTLVMPGFITSVTPPSVTIIQSMNTLYATPAYSYQWYNVAAGIIAGATGSYYIAPTVGSYYVIVTDIAGCTAISNTISVTAIAPFVNLMSSDTNFCEKQCIDFYDLSTNNPISWQWFFPGADSTTSTLQNPTNICYNNYGSFDVTLIACNAAGCDTLMIPGFINEYQQPIATIMQSNDTLFSSPGASYQWWSVSNGIIAGATNYYYVPTQGGDYFVIVTDTIGCQGTSNVITITGISFIGLQYLASASPNPFTNKIFISFQKQNIKEASFIVKNIPGQTVFSKHEKNLTNIHIKTIDLSYLPKGIYFLEIIIDGEQSIHKIVKQ
ncbi:MAG: PKD domain-containing protein [Bacteroidia bacterium]